MKSLFTAAITICAALTAASAGAVTIVSTPGAPDPALPAGQTMVWDFDGIAAPGFSWTGAITTVTGTAPGRAAPAGTTAGTFYGLITSNLPPAMATLSTPDLKTISFYWGSIDTYNFVDVLGTDGVLRSISGSDVFNPANGNQSAANTNRRVTFIADAGQVITGLRLRATGVAFEVDSFAAELADVGSLGGAVPEPASWAMLIAGFGLVGAANRRRRITVAA